MTTTRLVLARHGETVWHAENRYAGGFSDIDLTERGREQAGRLAGWCRSRHFDAVLVSPVRRARETAQPVGVALGMEPQVVASLREIDFGIAEGRTAAELTALDAAMMHRFESDPAAHFFPSADSPETAAASAAADLRAATRLHPGGRVLVIAHNTLLRLAMCALLDLPVSRYRQLFPQLKTARVTELDVPADPDRPASLISLNLDPRPPDNQG